MDKTVEAVRDAIFDVIWPTTEWDSEFACRAAFSHARGWAFPQSATFLPRRTGGEASS